MEKKVSLRNTQITFSIWDLGGQKEFISMIPLVCNESAVMLFLFDLARPATLASVKEWYRQVRAHNKTAIPFLVGTHFDVFAQQPPDAQVVARDLRGERLWQRCDGWAGGDGEDGAQVRCGDESASCVHVC